VNGENGKYSVTESIKKLDEFRKKYEDHMSGNESEELSSDRVWFWFCIGTIAFALYMVVMLLVR
jgi:hypothetical protein